MGWILAKCKMSDPGSYCCHLPSLWLQAPHHWRCPRTTELSCDCCYSQVATTPPLTSTDTATSGYCHQHVTHIAPILHALICCCWCYCVSQSSTQSSSISIKLQTPTSDLFVSHHAHPVLCFITAHHSTNTSSDPLCYWKCMYCSCYHTSTSTTMSPTSSAWHPP